MKTSTAQREVQTFTSEVHPEISTDIPTLGRAIEWADAHPDAWRIVLGAKSAAWGRASTHYLGWARGSDAPDAVLERVAVFRDYVAGVYPPGSPASIYDESAAFTLAHCRERGFRGDVFRQIDPDGFSRSCAILDTTPQTMDEVVARFRQWAEAPPCGHATAAVLVGGELAWGKLPAGWQAKDAGRGRRGKRSP